MGLNLIVIEVVERETAVPLLAKHEIGLVILDNELSDRLGVQALSVFQNGFPRWSTLVIVGSRCEAARQAMELTGLGCAEYH